MQVKTIQRSFHDYKIVINSKTLNLASSNSERNSRREILELTNPLGKSRSWLWVRAKYVKQRVEIVHFENNWLSYNNLAVTARHSIFWFSVKSRRCRGLQQENGSLSVLIVLYMQMADTTASVHLKGNYRRLWRALSVIRAVRTQNLKRPNPLWYMAEPLTTSYTILRPYPRCQDHLWITAAAHYEFCRTFCHGHRLAKDDVLSLWR